MASPTTENAHTAPPSLHAFFGRLRWIRNLSLATGFLSSAAWIAAANKRLNPPVIAPIAGTLTTLALSLAGTTHLLLNLNEQLENALNQPAAKPLSNKENSLNQE